MPVLELRNRIASKNAELAHRYWAREDVEDIVAERVQFFDELLVEIWQSHFAPATREHLALFAVGGYGRRELHPASDIDLLLLADNPQKYRDEIEPFVRSLFDLNLEVGYSVRTVKDCKTEAQKDITVATATFERRLLTDGTGPVAKLIAKLDDVMANPRLWPPEKFFKAKRDEQINRHRRYDNVDYDLEPNLKASPGGLRDLQTAMWICERQFGSSDPQTLQNLGVITEQERDWLINGKRYLWWVRYGLHLVAGRKDDRLQFEHQRQLARRLGYVDTGARLGVERFMHQYYRYVLTLREVNDILLLHVEETFNTGKPKREPINERFRIHNEYLETTHDRVFAEAPSALLEMFVIMANRRDISGVRAATIRLIRDHAHLIDEEFRNDPANTKLFLDLLKAPYTLVTQLTRMRRYGLLARYIPEFGEVVGQMQHDLFHIYTVDAHTMMVIGNLRRFRYRASAELYPVANHCVKTVPKIELLYIAGLYHDIGKGRGGDHSTLGAHDAVAFCRRHALNADDTELVEWLVKSHLVMSSTAQRKDIYDPDVVFEFAQLVKSERRLDYLYALTVADITATNPTLWNSWRATLLRHLYFDTRRMLRHGMESVADKQATLRACRESALEKLEGRLTEADVQPVWTLMGDEFLRRHTPRQIAALTERVHAHDVDSGALVLIENMVSQVAGEGATEIFVYTNDKPNLFAASVIALDHLNLSVYDANIRTSEGDALCFNTYVVLNEDRQPISGDREPLVELLAKQIDNPNIAVTKRRVPRQQKQLTRPTQVRLENRAADNFSTLTILTADRSGLLARIGLLFHELGVRVLDARITTLGERVEDVFYVQDQAGEPIQDSEDGYLLENTLRQQLDTLVA